MKKSITTFVSLTGRLCLTALVLWAKPFAQLFAQTPIVENVQQLGFIDLSYRSPADRSVAGVWGFTQDDREYALVPITDAGISIVEVTDPTNPVEVSFVPMPAGTDRLYYAQYSKGYIYAIMRPGPLQIINAKDPANAFTETLYQPNFSSVYGIFIADTLLHLSDVDGAPSGIKNFFLDISDPVNPVEVSSFPGAYHHSYIRGNTLYGWYFGGGCDIVDISDFKNVFIKETITVGTKAHGGWLNDAGTVLISDQEFPGGHLKLWDVSGPGPTTLISEFATPTNYEGETSIHRSFWYGDLIYMSYWRDGFRVADASNPDSVVQVGVFDNDNPNSDGLLRGGWQAFPYLPSRNVLYTDRKRGLYVLDYLGDGPGLRHDPPDVHYDANQPLTATFEVINGPSVDVASSAVYWRTSKSAPWQQEAIVATGTANVYEFTITPPADARQIYYYIKAMGTNGQFTRAPGLAPYIDWYEVPVTNSSPPVAAPANLVATASGDTLVDLSWTDQSDNEDGFVIERKVQGDSAFAVVDSTAANSTTFADMTVSSNTTYVYRVYAYNADLNSAYSNEATATTAPGANDPPAAPGSLSASAAGETTIDLSWLDQSSNETGFRIERRLANTSFAQIATVAANTTAYSDTGLATSTAYTYRVFAYNAAGDSPASNEASATTGVANTPPTAVAEATPQSGAAPLDVSFTGSNSSDADGTISSYAWDFGDGTTASVADTTHTYSTEGDYSAVLTVTDDAGATDTDTVRISVTAPAANQPPTATITQPADGASYPSGATISYSGTGTDPEDGTLPAANFTWLVDLPNGQNDVVVATGVTSGTATTQMDGPHVLKLVVQDSEGLTDTARVSITVGGVANQPPTAVAEADPTSGTAPLDVQFTGSNSTDSDGTITSYAWDFGDGTSASIADPSHTYTDAGTYTATLTVTDDDGATGSDSIEITVSSGAVNQPPVATITQPQAGQTFVVGETINYSGTGTDPEDGELPAANFTWTVLAPDGQIYPLATGVKSGASTATSPGSYTIRLEVQDSEGATDLDQVQITVTGTAVAGKKAAGLLDASTLPENFVLEDAFPNPFNPETRIRIQLPAVANINLAVYDRNGRLVKIIVKDQPLAPGSYTYRWSGDDLAGQPVASGVYLIRMQAGAQQFLRKVSLIR